MAFSNLPYLLSDRNKHSYNQNGFIKLKQVFSSEEINHYNEIISDQVNSMIEEIKPINQRDTYGKAFLQLFNLWEKNETIKQLVFNTRIAKIAAD